MLSILCVRLTIKVKVGIPESLKVGWCPPKKTGSSDLKFAMRANRKYDVYHLNVGRRRFTGLYFF